MRKTVFRDFWIWESAHELYAYLSGRCGSEAQAAPLLRRGDGDQLSADCG